MSCARSLACKFRMLFESERCAEKKKKSENNADSMFFKYSLWDSRNRASSLNRQSRYCYIQCENSTISDDKSSLLLNPFTQ